MTFSPGKDDARNTWFFFFWGGGIFHHFLGQPPLTDFPGTMGTQCTLNSCQQTANCIVCDRLLKPVPWSFSKVAGHARHFALSRHCMQWGPTPDSTLAQAGRSHPAYTMQVHGAWAHTLIMFESTPTPCLATEASWECRFCKFQQHTGK